MGRMPRIAVQVPPIKNQNFTVALTPYASESLLEAADLLLDSNHALPKSYLEQADQLGLQTAQVVELRTAVFIDDQPQLVELKAVSSGYPLRGQLEKKKQRLAEVIGSERGPEPGEVWVDIKLAEQIGQDLEIGFQRLPANWILHFEPDRGGSLFNLAPRVMMHIDDLPATGLLVEGSRARYKLLVAGDASAVREYKTLIEAQLAEGEQLQSIENALEILLDYMQNLNNYNQTAIELNYLTL